MHFTNEGKGTVEVGVPGNRADSCQSCGGQGHTGVKEGLLKKIH